MNHTCPYCEGDLSYEDEYYSGRPERFYGTASNGIYYPSTKVHLGDIFKCRNEECEEYQKHFYTDKHGHLHEGYPC